MTMMPYISLFLKDTKPVFLSYPITKIQPESAIRLSSCLTVPEPLMNFQNFSFKQNNILQNHTLNSFTADLEGRVPSIESCPLYSQHLMDPSQAPFHPPTGTSCFPQRAGYNNALRWSEAHV